MDTSTSPLSSIGIDIGKEVFHCFAPKSGHAVGRF
jgi:hypothetical protein